MNGASIALVVGVVVLSGVAAQPSETARAESKSLRTAGLAAGYNLDYPEALDAFRAAAKSALIQSVAAKRRCGPDRAAGRIAGRSVRRRYAQRRVPLERRPPPYPYEIDRELAERGRRLFYSRSVGCSRCHGVYDGRGNLDWQGVHKDVGTDPAHREIVSEGFRAAFASSPLAAEGALVKSEGYAATPLTGVWANYPYLHNGSIPTLYHLLGPVSGRPKIFHVMAARHLDQEKVGQPLYPSRVYGWLPERELLRRYGDDRDWFSTTRPGSSNAGHDVWWRIGTDENRKALIEYLKTL